MAAVRMLFYPLPSFPTPAFQRAIFRCHILDLKPMWVVMKRFFGGNGSAVAGRRAADLHRRFSINTWRRAVTAFAYLELDVVAF
ncbi:MAG: hypothetical protein AB1586_21320 [Pseudomonadota bacterium]|jgi:hypothetical protein